MSWIDILIILFIFLIIYGGIKRGLILEAADIFILIINLGITLHLYHYLARILIELFKWNEKLAYNFSFGLIFILIGVILYIIALAINGLAKLAVVFSAPNQIGGGLFACIKVWPLIWLFLFMFAILPLGKDFQKEFYKAPTVKMFKRLTPFFVSVVDSLAPSFATKNLKLILKKVHFN
ncbi:MAG: CvpA family protein [Armatimonadetes bacterium]|nr:CvpA family protein [Armatimonadota bacterium]